MFIVIERSIPGKKNTKKIYNYEKNNFYTISIFNNI